MSEFQGLVAAVTGAGSGIGLETAKLLKERGATVFGLDINEGAMVGVAQFIKCDVSDDASVEQAFKSISNLLSNFVRSSENIKCFIFFLMVFSMIL